MTGNDQLQREVRDAARNYNPSNPRPFNATMAALVERHGAEAVADASQAVLDMDSTVRQLKALTGAAGTE